MANLLFLLCAERGMRETNNKIQIEVCKVISGSAEGKFAIAALVTLIFFLVLVGFLSALG